MKRITLKITCGLVAMVAVGGALAVEVSPEQAQTAARNWVKNNPRPMTARIKSSKVRSVKTSQNEAGRALYHSVDLEDGGFVVLSGDTRLPPVIAFSDCGSMESLPKNHPLRDLLEHDLAQRIDEVTRSNASALVPKTAMRESVSGNTQTASRFEDSWAELLDTTVRPAKAAKGGSVRTKISDVCVYPLIETKWGQDQWNRKDTFNLFTPEHFLCGCGATATAQIMKRWKFPNSVSDDRVHVCSVNGIKTNIVIKSKSYNWGGMPLSEKDCNTDAQRKALGELAYDVGVAANMDWRKNASGTSLYDCVHALRETFGYAASCYYEEKAGLTVNIDKHVGFRNAILASLDAEMPVEVGVHGERMQNGKKKETGHAVVVDGYGYDNDVLYCHINCGWDGKGNVWYDLLEGEITLGSTHTYSKMSEIAYNIHPTDKGSVISGRVLNSSGNPVSGAIVNISPAGLKRSSTTSDRRGVFYFRVNSGTYSISARKGDRESETAEAILQEECADGKLGNKWGVKLYLPRVEEDDTPPEPDDEDPGTETGTGTIKSEADWIALASSKYAQSATFSIGADLYLSDTRCVVSDFCGTVKGNGHTITIDRKLEAWHLFGTPRGATFERVSFSGVSLGTAVGCAFVKCRPKDIPLVKEARDCTFTDCMGTVSIATSTFQMGALSCFAKNCTFKNCKVWGSLSGGNNTGGLVGDAEGSTFTDCISLAKVSGDSEVGGLVGWAEADCQFSNCAARGEVSGSGFVGGLVGYCEGSTLNGCQATGNVSGGKVSGGFAGQLRNCEVQKCSAKGKVTCDVGRTGAPGDIGGFAGEIVGIDDGRMTLAYCAATGAVLGDGGTGVGGFVGDCHGETATTKIQCSYASGAVIGGTFVGGFAGELSECSIFNCYSTGSSTANGYSMSSGSSLGIDTGASAYVGGFAGQADSKNGVDCRYCYAVGYVKTARGTSILAYSGGLTPLLLPDEQADMMGSMLSMFTSDCVSCYWSIPGTGRKYSGMGTGKSADDMKRKNTFTGWDFSSIWTIDEGTSYPYFQELGKTGVIDDVGDDRDEIDGDDPGGDDSGGGDVDFSVTVTFNANGGTVSPTTKKLEKDDEIGTLPTPSRGGDSFAGWWTEANGGWLVTEDTIIFKDMTLYAHWVEMPVDYCTVTFNANGGTVSPTKRTVEKGKAVGDVPTPTLSGYVFDGWYTQASGGIKITASTKVTANVTYYAHWKQAGGMPNLVVNSVTACRRTVYIGETFHLRYTIANTGKATSGASVSGISDGNNRYSGSQFCAGLTAGAGQDYRLNINSSTLGVGTHTITVTADSSGRVTETSESDNSKTISLTVINLPETSSNVDWQFHARSGGSDVAYLSKSASSTTATTTFKQGETIYVQINFWNALMKNTTGEVKAAALLDTGNGTQWNWTSLGSGTTAYITDSARAALSLQNLPPGTYTLEFLLDNARFHGGSYVWNESNKLNNAKTIEFTVVGNAFTVTLDPTGGNVSPATRSVAVGATVGTLPTPTRANYTFAGWFTAASGGTQVTAATKVTGNVTYYAHWYDDRAGRIVVRSVTPAAAGGIVRIVLGRTGGSAGRIAVKFKTQTSTGICGTDFAYVKDVLVWEDGDASDKVIEIPTYGSGAGKQLRVKLATLTTGAYAGCVTPKLAESKVYADMTVPNPGTITVTAPDPLSVTAGETLRMTLSRTGGSDGKIAVKAKTQTSTALMGTNGSADFDYVKKTFEWADGDATDRYLDIPTYVQPWEGVKMLRVKLATLATGAYAGNLTPALAESKIYAEIESPVAFGTVYVAPEAARPAAGEALRLVFRRTGGSDYPIAVKYKVQTSTAVAGTDFEYKKGVVTWGDGESDDKVVEVPTYPSAAGKQLRVKLSTLTQGEYTGCVTPHLNSAKVYVPLR